MANNNSTLTQREVLSRDFSRVLPLILAIERIKKPDLKCLIKETCISEKSIYSMLYSLRGRYRMVIEWKRELGYYQILDWGCLDREKIVHSLK